MAEEEKELPVRAIDGQSTAVKLAAAASVRDLKALLRSSFPPAQISPNFHLFLKGAKLQLEAQIGSLVFGPGEFIVLIPFKKKSEQCPPLGKPGTQHSINQSKPSEVSSGANSVWQDIVDDLLSMPRSPAVDAASKDPCCSSNLYARCHANVSTSMKSSSNVSKKRKLCSQNENVVREIFSSGMDSAYEQSNMSKICGVVESVGCLLNDVSGNCLLFEEFNTMSDMSEKCLCPLWMKRLTKAFSFLNLVYAVFQIQCKCMMWDNLEYALEQSKSFGSPDISKLDVEILSHLCPKIVVIQSKPETLVPRLTSVIIIGSPADEQCSSSTAHGNGRKHSSTSAAINALIRRWTAFKSELLNLIRCCMGRQLSKKSTQLEYSLQDLMSIKDSIAVVETSEAKRVKSTSRALSCHGLYPLEPAEMVEHLKQGLGKEGQIVHIEEIPAREVSYADLPDHLCEATREALKNIGISRLYSHQAQAIQSSISGRHVVVATSTSSGKSLCYNVPVLESFSQSLISCALYIFPTKALAQDQLRTLQVMKNGFHTDINAKIYDGDTPKEDRAWIRDNARLLITNPDMLHMSILPYHSQFQRILSNLRYIIIDEAHSYKGAFGCHTALILRRLRRICSNIYGNDPTFIFCTATSANPCEHVMELAKLDTVELIQNDGSPCGPKYFLLWNPPLHTTKKPEALGSKGDGGSLEANLATRRSSSIVEVSYLFAEMVQHGLRCIAFCKTRKLCELVLLYTREILQETANELVDSVCVYRAGYIAEDRRKIEADLFEGKLCGVAATNALELGIDVGHIDATLHLGFPGSIASLWQQAGRSGRRAKPSMAVYVAFEGPLDQYFMKFPHKLFSRPIEHCQVDSNNHKVLEQHLACAAYENPLCLQYDENYFGSSLNGIMMALKDKGYLINNPGRPLSSRMWNYIGCEKRPSYAVSIRAIEHDKYRVINKSSNQLLEEIEESKAFFQVYEGAVYMHQGINYMVEELDLSSRTAFCRKADLKYYTKTRDYTDINVLGGEFAYLPISTSRTSHVRTTAQANDCRVTTKWFGFYRIWKSSNQIFDSIELNLPPYSFDSQVVWVRISQTVKSTVLERNLQFRGGAHAASHALLHVVPLYMMCNTSDLGTECANPHETRDIPERILLYDKHPGGIGIASQVKMLFGELLVAALELVSTCSCISSAGCPNCIQTLTCSEYNEVLHKEAAILILKGVIQYERLYFEEREDSHES